ncbi:MAG: hypothetical protein HY329_18430, partial [Chloroflexi bacterium]|nr:hypothetical protein [Chloroflexota bacterium]
MFKSVIRTLSFFSKEIREAVRQPSLIFTLVLGPFFILLVFGLGARPHRPPLSTVLVIPADAPLSRDAAVYEKKLQPAAKLYALTDDAPAAERAIRENAADVALIVPPNVWETVIRGEQAPLRI